MAEGGGRAGPGPAGNVRAAAGPRGGGGPGRLPGPGPCVLPCGRPGPTEPRPAAGGRSARLTGCPAARFRETSPRADFPSCGTCTVTASRLASRAGWDPQL